MCAARVDAAISAVIQKQTGKSENGLKKFPITFGPEAMFLEVFHFPFLLRLAVFNPGVLAAEDVASEILRLRTFVEIVV